MSKITLGTLDLKLNNLIDNFAHLRTKTSTLEDKQHLQATDLTVVKGSLDSIATSLEHIFERLKTLEIESIKKAGVSGFVKFVMTIPGLFTVIAAIVLGGAVQDLLLDLVKR